jgi:hypothetical protein
MNGVSNPFLALPTNRAAKTGVHRSGYGPAEARQLGLAPEEIGPYLHRPASSVAKLIDEWFYATITGGLAV